MSHHYPAKRDSLFGWLSEFSDADWFPKEGSHEESSLSIYEDQGLIVVEAALPGLKPEEVEVTFDKGTLWIRGERKEQEGDKSKKYYKKASTSFSYSLRVPGDIDLDLEPSALFKHGVMKVSFKRKHKTEPKKIKIQNG
jgi:HSP20 family protein